MTVTSIPFAPRTKFRPPRLAKDVLFRSRLLERLDRPAALTLIIAPAGYGKTTLAGTWLARRSRPGAWVSLDSEDNTLAVFLQRFVTAVRSVFPAFGGEILSLLASSADMSAELTTDLAADLTADLTRGLTPEAVLPILLNDLDRLDQDFVLVLDDYHHIADSSIHQLLWGLLAHPPRPLQLVLTARHDPPIPPRIRVQGAVTELRARDLSFTPAETIEFLRQFVEQPLDDQSISDLVKQSEGWAVSMRLVALSLRQQLEVASLQDALRRCGHSLLGYLDFEVIGHLPLDVQLFLARTSVLRQLNGPLCDAVLGDSLPHIDSLTTLRMLEQSGIFVTALDAEGQWFEYHGLFRTLLKHRLRSTHEPAAIDALNQRAHVWYEQHEPCEDTVHHARDLDDQASAGALAARLRPLVPVWQESQQPERWRSVFAQPVEQPVVPLPPLLPPLPAPLPVRRQHSLSDTLTFREMDVMLLLYQRLTNKEIAHGLCISPETVRQHTVNIYRKLGVANRRQAVVQASAMGLQAELSR